MLLAAASVLLLAACGGSNSSTSASQDLQRQADINAIDQIEKTWHKAASTQDVDLMMSMWAPDATFTVGGSPFVGSGTDPGVLREGAGPFQPGEQLGLRHARVQDPDHGERRQGNALLRVRLRRRDDGKGGQRRRRRPERPEDRREMADHELSPRHRPRSVPDSPMPRPSGPGGSRSAGRRRCCAGSRAHSSGPWRGSRHGADEAARRVRADRRPARRRRRPRPARARSSRTHRVEALGTLQLRAATYQSLQTQAQQLRQLLAVRAAADPGQQYAAARATRRRSGVAAGSLVDEAIAAPLSQLGPATNESRFGFMPPPRDRALLRRIRSTHARFTATLDRMIELDRSGRAGAESRSLLTDAIDDGQRGSVRSPTSSRRRHARRPTR